MQTIIKWNIFDELEAIMAILRFVFQIYARKFQLKFDLSKETQNRDRNLKNYQRHALGSSSGRLNPEFHQNRAITASQIFILVTRMEQIIWISVYLRVKVRYPLGPEKT